ncbi:MAG: Flp pilus assembly protein CpaB [Pseudomonadota bacterium]
MLIRILIFFVAVGAAGAAGWLTLKAGDERQMQQAAAVQIMQEPPTKLVLVAGTDVPGGDVLAPSKLKWQAWPINNLNSAFILRETRPNAVSELSGSFVNSAFVAGEPILEARLMETNINLMSNNLSPGKRAVAVKISAENTAGGFILPGDRVDVLHTKTEVEDGGKNRRNESRIIISNVRVMAIDQNAIQNPEGSALGKTATLELTPQETERVMEAEASGLLSLALRSVADHDIKEPVEEAEEVRTVRVHRAIETSIVTLRPAVNEE